jgi:S1-C subfamily serine protease
LARFRSDGYILTNNHVISVAASGGSVQVLFADGQTEAATITGRDPQTDLAVLHIQPSHGLKVIALGSSSTVKVGEPVVAIGAPLGLSGTVTGDRHTGRAAVSYRTTGESRLERHGLAGVKQAQRARRRSGTGRSAS